jgi:hypothetical protein
MLRKLGGEFENLKMRIVRFQSFPVCIQSRFARTVVGRWSFDICHFPPFGQNSRFARVVVRLLASLSSAGASCDFRLLTLHAVGQICKAIQS